MDAAHGPVATLADRLSGLSIEDVPEAGRRLVERCFVDTVGVGLAGAEAAAGRLAAETVAAAYGEDGPGALWGRSAAAPIAEASFVNATAAHALDYDDMARGMDGHPSVTLVPTILAVAPAEAGGADLIAAYVAGFEAQCALSAPNRKGRTGDGLHARGFHPTAVFGTFGAAAAAAHLLDLDPGETLAALNAAASMTAGLSANFGSLTKPVQVGHAARSGCWAALLAARGLTAVDEAIVDGFLPAYAGVADLDPAVLPGPDDELAITAEGVAIKRYPACYLTHTTIRATAELASAHGLDPETVARIHVDVSEEMASILPYDAPATEDEAKFSIPHAVAVAIAEDHVGLDAFSPSTIEADRVRRLRDRVEYTVDPAVPRGSYAVTVTVETTDGDRLVRGEDTPPATMADPLPHAALERKFRDCAARSLPAADVDRAFALLDDLRDLDSLAPLTAALTAR